MIFGGYQGLNPFTVIILQLDCEIIGKFDTIYLVLNMDFLFSRCGQQQMSTAYPHDQNTDPPYRLYLFGAFELVSGEQVLHLPTKKTELLLAYLALNHNPQPREKLAALFWGDSSEEQAGGSLRKALTHLRKALGDETLLADRETVQINPAYPLWVDALDFQDQANQFLAVSSPNPDAVDIDLYQDDLLAHSYEDWISPWRDQLRDLYFRTLSHIVQLYQARGEYERAIVFAGRILARDPANEDTHHHLMVSYWSAGNRNAALKQYELCRKALLDDLGVEPSPKTTAFYQRIQQEINGSSQTHSLTNLPASLTSFIGREKEIPRIQRLLTTSRILTLTGAGGCGKTRLAIQVARELLNVFPDGIWWVELAPLADEMIVPQVVAKALGFGETSNQPILDILTDRISSKQVLLVLDNCEHLIRTCAQLAEILLTHCPNLKILATSREALNIAGEVTWTVPSLQTPNPKHSFTVSELLKFESVRLFIDRARMNRPQFNLTLQNAPAIIEVCAELEGIPLAIELAAARVKTLSVEQIAARLNDRFNLLNTGSRMALPRHQTLRAVIDWSYDLLAEPEKQLLRWGSVFAGSFTLEAVEYLLRQIEGTDHPVTALNRLEQLINKSLVLVEEEIEDNQNRYSCLETIRQYAFEKLCAAKELDVTRDAHLAYFAGLLDQASTEMQGTEWVRWTQRFEREMDNLRAMQEWALESDPVRALEIGSTEAFMRFWGRTRYGVEASRWLQEALDRMKYLPDVDENDAEGRLDRRKWAEAKGLTSLGLTSTALGDYRKSFNSLQSGLILWRALGDPSGQALCLSMMGTQAMLIGRYQESLQYAQECLSIARAIGDDLSAAVALTNFGFYHIRQENNIERGLAYLEESIQLINRQGNQWNAGIPILYVGRFMAERGNYARGKELLEKANRIFAANVDRLFLNITRSGLADIAHIERDYPLAETLYMETAVEWERIGNMGAMARCLECLAFIVCECAKEIGNDGQRNYLYWAGKLLGAADHLRKNNNAAMMVHEQEEYNLRMDAVRELANSDTFETAWVEGQALERDGIVAFLRRVED